MLRLALVVCLCCAPAGAARALAAPKDPLAVEIARLDVDQAKLVEIVSQLKSADGRELDIVLKPKAEQFTVDFDLTNREFQRIRIRVVGAKNSRVVRYFTDLKRRQVYIELAKLPGVEVLQLGKDTVIDFTTAKAALVLPPGGRLLFKQYAPGLEPKE